MTSLARSAGTSGTWVLHSSADLERLSDVWDGLNAAGPDTPLLDSEFFRFAITHFGSGDEVVAVCHADQEPVAATLLSPVGSGRWATFQPAQAPLGPWLSTTAFEPLSSLALALPGAALQVGVTQQDPRIYPSPVADGRITTLDYIRTADLPISGSFDDYWAQRGKNLRQNLRRQRNRLERESISTRLVAVTEAEEIAAAVDNYGLLESAGWKGKEGTALHPDNSQGRFYKDLLVSYSRRKEATVFQFYYEGRLVACDLCLHRNRVLVVLKTTHDESQKTSSPTFLMREQVLQQLFRDNAFDRVEFYGKLMDWHTKWTSSVRCMYHVNFWRWQWLRRLFSVREKLRADSNASSSA